MVPHTGFVYMKGRGPSYKKLTLYFLILYTRDSWEGVNSEKWKGNHHEDLFDETRPVSVQLNSVATLKGTEDVVLNDWSEVKGWDRGSTSL